MQIFAAMGTGLMEQASMQQLFACFRVFRCVYDIPLFNLELLAAIGTGKIGDMWF